MVLESTSFCLSYKIQRQKTTVMVLTVLAVSAVFAVSVVMATPLKPTPPLFRHPELRFRGPGTSVKTAKIPKSGHGKCSKSFGVFQPRVPKESLTPSKPCFAPGETA